MDLRGRTHSLIKALGYEGRETYFNEFSDASNFQYNHVINQAISSMRVAGVFSLKDGFANTRLKPIVYVAMAEDAEELRAIWRDVWSQGVTPFLLVVTNEHVAVCNGFEAPHEGYAKHHFDAAHVLVEGLAYFTAPRISSSVTWHNFELSTESSVDHTLVAAIEALHERAIKDFPKLASRPDLVNALIGKFIYTYVLIDRGILSSEWLKETIPSELSEYTNALTTDLVGGRDDLIDATGWHIDAVFAVFREVDLAINGSVFQISVDEQHLIPLELCYLIHRVVRCGEILVVGGSQRSFFDVSFEILRTETISAIYESFVALEDGTRRKNDGIYYTPPHLADHVLDRVEELRIIDRTSTVIDPSAGSGIFLVGAYRRLLERHAPADGWSPEYVAEARSLLLGCIFGYEKHPQAANVCRFSLYLTMLDYVGRAPISTLVAAAGDEKFLPPLTENILTMNAFSAIAGTVQYSHVIGNPPWSAFDGQRDRRNNQHSTEGDETTRAFALSLEQKRTPVGHKRLSDLFVWLAKMRLSHENGVIAFVLPTKSLVGRQSDRFAHALASELTVRWVGNLSHLRRKLFPGSEAPACLVVAINASPTSNDRVLVYRPLLSSLPSGKNNEVWSLLASQSDLDLQRSVDLQSGDNGWFRQTMLSSLDRRTSDAMRLWSIERSSTFGHFLDNSGLVISKGGSPAETGIIRDEREPITYLRSSDMKLVKPGFRGRFFGNVVVVPRSMAPASYHSGPVAYSSSYNAILPKGQHLDLLLKPDTAIRHLPQQAVISLVRYLDSGVVRYLASLFGASYLMDKARFEKNDLLSLPCPYEDIESAAFLALADASSVDDAILDALDAGPPLRDAFHEFNSFRSAYANSQTPHDIMNAPSAEMKARYTERLVEEVCAAFDRRREIKVGHLDISAERTDIIVDFLTPESRNERGSPKSADVSGQFLSSSIVSLNRPAGYASISKPEAKFAWTLDQAVADALALRREIRRQA